MPTAHCSVSYTTHFVGDTVTYQCHNGYHFKNPSHPATLVCLDQPAFAVWSDIFPVCVRAFRTFIRSQCLYNTTAILRKLSLRTCIVWFIYNKRLFCIKIKIRMVVLYVVNLFVKKPRLCVILRETYVDSNKVLRTILIGGSRNRGKHSTYKDHVLIVIIPRKVSVK